MPVPLIPCRLKSDHTVTHDIGETALGQFPDWEPIPATDAPADAPAVETQADPGPEPAPASTRKPARKTPPASNNEKE